MDDREQQEGERRRDPRYPRNFSVRVEHESADGLKAESINLSTRGLYCRVSRFVHPFSKLRVALELPFGSKSAERIECEGVVVRVEPGPGGENAKEYRLAIYFLNLQREAARQIAEFLAEPH